MEANFFIAQLVTSLQTKLQQPCQFCVRKSITVNAVHRNIHTFCNLDKIFLFLLSCDSIFHRSSCMLSLALFTYSAFFVLLKNLHFPCISMWSGPVNLATYPHWSKRDRMAGWLMELQLYVHGKYGQQFPCSATQPVLFLSSFHFFFSILCLRAVQTCYYIVSSVLASRENREYHKATPWRRHYILRFGEALLLFRWSINFPRNCWGCIFFTFSFSCLLTLWNLKTHD